MPMHHHVVFEYAGLAPLPRVYRVPMNHRHVRAVYTSPARDHKRDVIAAHVVHLQCATKVSPCLACRGRPHRVVVHLDKARKPVRIVMLVHGKPSSVLSEKYSTHPRRARESLEGQIMWEIRPVGV